MSPPFTVAHVLEQTNPILLDFDGPICSVFATTSGETVADELRRLLVHQGVVIPASIAHEPDPLAVLRHTTVLDDTYLVARVDDTLREAERHAIDGATPTPYGREVIVAAHHAGRPLAIVSNNSAPAVHAYLASHRLSTYIDCVIGRPNARPDLMKPNPQPVLAAVTALGAQPTSCAFLGDSTSDIAAGQAAGVRTIGYANKPNKLQRLTEAGADAIADGTYGLAEIARLLHDEVHDNQSQ